MSEYLNIGVISEYYTYESQNIHKWYLQNTTDKSTVDRRVALLAAEGISFVTKSNITKLSDLESSSDFDAIVLATGSTTPRDVDVDFNRIHFAMEFLTKNQQRLQLMTVDGTLESGWSRSNYVSAEGKNVVVLGGGDTGTDVIGTSMRQRCKSIVNLEVMPEPPVSRSLDNPWPEYPRVRCLVGYFVNHIMLRIFIFEILLLWILRIFRL